MLMEIVGNIQEQIFDTLARRPSWRSIFPVNPFGMQFLEHPLRSYTNADIQNGKFFYVSNIKKNNRCYIGLIRTWRVHKSEMVVVNGQVRADSILRMTVKMDDQIEKLLISGEEIDGKIEKGILNYNGIQKAISENNTEITEIGNIIYELKNLLENKGFSNRTKWVLIHDLMIDGYLDMFNSITGYSPRENLISDNILSKSQMIPTRNIMLDSGDAAIALIECDESNFFVEELMNGIRVGMYNTESIPDNYIYGYLEWAGSLTVEKPESITKRSIKMEMS